MWHQRWLEGLRERVATSKRVRVEDLKGETIGSPVREFVGHERLEWDEHCHKTHARHA